MYPYLFSEIDLCEWLPCFHFLQQLLPQLNWCKCGTWVSALLLSFGSFQLLVPGKPVLVMWYVGVWFCTSAPFEFWFPSIFYTLQWSLLPTFQIPVQTFYIQPSLVLIFWIAAELGSRYYLAVFTWLYLLYIQHNNFSSSAMAIAESSKEPGYGEENISGPGTRQMTNNIDHSEVEIYYQLLSQADLPQRFSVKHKTGDLDFP